MTDNRLSIHIRPAKLTDGSEVFSVVLRCGDSDQSVVFDAIDGKAADRIADDLITTIQKNTNERVDFSFGITAALRVA